MPLWKRKDYVRADILKPSMGGLNIEQQGELKPLKVPQEQTTRGSQKLFLIYIYISLSTTNIFTYILILVFFFLACRLNYKLLEKKIKIFLFIINHDKL